MATVTIGCKLPHGIILRLFDLVDKVETTPAGSRTVKEAVELPQRVVLNGFSHPQNAAPKCLIVEGAAITNGVDKDFWELWLLQNKDSDLVKNKMIWAHEKGGQAEAEAKDRKSQRSGLERLDPSKLPSKIKMADEMKSRVAA